jgi:2-iminobutanoate/2-iminopropanoate deaminase
MAGLEIIAPNGERDAALTYSPGILVSGSPVTLYISGQVGIASDGTVSADFETQVRQVWQNISGVLRGAGMRLENLVKLTTFLIDAADFPISSRVRTEVLGGHKPASTLVYVSGLVRPEWRVEIEAIAARTP